MSKDVGALPTVIAGLLVLGTAGCKSLYPSVFREAEMDWHGLNGGGIDSGVLAECIAPMVNPGG